MRDGDIWPEFTRASTTEFPGADEIERACAQANMRFKEEAERTPGTYVDPIIAQFPVRAAQCRWETGVTATALCRFQQTQIEIDEDRAEALSRLRDRDWEPMASRLVHVSGPLHNGPGWIAPAGCSLARTEG